MALEDDAADVSAAALRAWELPEVKAASRKLGGGENWSLVRAMLAITIAAQQDPLRRQIGELPPRLIGECCE